LLLLLYPLLFGFTCCALGGLLELGIATQKVPGDSLEYLLMGVGTGRNQARRKRDREHFV